MTQKIQIGAHRGWRARYPENTAIALEKAIEKGAVFVEFDVQISADGIPVLMHDASLLRTCGIDRSLFDLTAKQLTAMSAHEPERFGDHFKGTAIPKLDDALTIIRGTPAITAFIEIKTESVIYHGRHPVLTIIQQALSKDYAQCVLISDDEEVTRAVKSLGLIRAGWIVRDLKWQTRRLMQKLSPDFIIINHKRIENDTVLPKGPWSWMCYEVNDQTVLDNLTIKGVGYIETADLEKIDPQSEGRTRE